MIEETLEVLEYLKQKGFIVGKLVNGIEKYQTTNKMKDLLKMCNTTKNKILLEEDFEVREDLKKAIGIFRANNNGKSYTVNAITTLVVNICNKIKYNDIVEYKKLLKYINYYYKTNDYPLTINNFFEQGLYMDYKFFDEKTYIEEPKSPYSLIE